jgi:hypothetical protein
MGDAAPFRIAQGEATKRSHALDLIDHIRQITQRSLPGSAAQTHL